MVHLLLRNEWLGSHCVGQTVVAVYATRKAANAEAKRRNASPYGRHSFFVKSKAVIGE